MRNGRRLRHQSSVIFQELCWFRLIAARMRMEIEKVYLSGRRRPRVALGHPKQYCLQEAECTNSKPVWPEWMQTGWQEGE